LKCCIFKLRERERTKVNSVCSVVHTTLSAWGFSPGGLGSRANHASSIELCSSLRASLTCGTREGSRLVGGVDGGEKYRAKDTLGLQTFESPLKFKRWLLRTPHADHLRYVRGTGLA